MIFLRSGEALCVTARKRKHAVLLALVRSISYIVRKERYVISNALLEHDQR